MAVKGAKGPATILRRDAVALGVVFLLVGVFLGWQGALLVVNQDAAQSRQGAAAQMPPMPGQAPGQAQGGAVGGMNQMMSQAKAMEEQAAKTPGDYRVWVALGNLYFDTDMHQKSIEAYEKALAIKPDLPDVWTDMGVMYRAVRKPDQAVASFDKALGFNPRHEVALLNKGVVILFDLGDQAGAAKAFAALVAVNPQAKTPDGKKVADILAELGGKAGK